MRVTFAVIPFAVILALTASAAAGTRCGHPSITLDVRPERVAPGDSLRLVLRNGSTEALGYNLCLSALERRVDDTRQTVPSDRVCTMELRILAPNQAAEYATEVPDTLSAGEYRYTTEVEWMEHGVRNPISSHPFRVER
jgi:hypothetical protein